MDIATIDKNFALRGIGKTDVEWFDALSSPFSLHGVFYDEETDLYLRMPRQASEKVSRGVHFLAPMTAGGRLRFVTDSPYVAIKCVAPAFEPMSHMSLTGSHGFALYTDGRFEARFGPSFKSFDPTIDFGDAIHHSIAFEGVRDIYGANGTPKLCELYFPLYGGVKTLRIGIKKGSKLQAPPSYKISVPVVFYGSSITQGACVTRPGNDYISTLSRWLDFDFVNLGFSGNGNAEKEMLDYLVSIPASAYVFDYNYYTDRPDRVLPPHLSIYERFRSAKKDVPIVLTDKPAIEYDPIGKKRRDIIYDTYHTALSRGDKKVAFIETESMFGNENRDACTVDTCHPTDYGAFRMAEAFAPVLKALLYENS